MNVLDMLKAHASKKQDQMNAAFRELYDRVQCSKCECDELIMVLNEKLPGEGNLIAHHLRKVLCLAIDMIDTEDAAVKVMGYPLST